MQLIKPESANQVTDYSVSIFLAGSIEMGEAEDWQAFTQQELADFEVTIFNPRRGDWDSSWEQKESNDQFNYQVNWELNRLNEASLILMYFAPGTQSPISLLELGDFAKDKKMIVCCPEGFWRKGNVDIFCNRNSIPVYSTLNAAIGALKTKLSMLGKFQ